jgi:hypothetical protein
MGKYVKCANELKSHSICTNDSSRSFLFSSPRTTLGTSIGVAQSHILIVNSRLTLTGHLVSWYGRCPVIGTCARDPVAIAITNGIQWLHADICTRTLENLASSPASCGRYRLLDCVSLGVWSYWLLFSETATKSSPGTRLDSSPAMDSHGVRIPRRKRAVASVTFLVDPIFWTGGGWGSNSEVARKK